MSAIIILCRTYTLELFAQNETIIDKVQRDHRYAYFDNYFDFVPPPIHHEAADSFAIGFLPTSSPVKYTVVVHIIFTHITLLKLIGIYMIERSYVETELIISTNALYIR